MDGSGLRRLWFSAPVLCFLAALGAVWVVVAPVGAPVQWRAAGIAALVGALLGLAAVVAIRRPVPWTLVALAALGLGWWRGAAVMVGQATPWTDVPNEPMHLLAVVDAPVETRGASATILARVDEVDGPPGLTRPRGRIQITAPALPPIQMGDLVEIEGRLRPTDPSDPWDRRLLAQGVVATTFYPRLTPGGPAGAPAPTAPIHRLRDDIEGTIDRILPEPHAALLTGLLVGAGSGMPDDFRTALVAAGLTHVVVASGYNVTLVAGALRGLVRLPGRARVLPQLLGVWGFTLLAGATAPSLRAAMMTCVALIAVETGRGTDAMLALLLAASAMLLHDPRLALDLSFQLSALATFGLIALTPRLMPLLGRLPRLLGEPLANTLAAELVTAPLLAATFFRISLVAPITNVIVGPLIPIATIGGGIGVPLAMMLPPVAPFVAALLIVPTAAIVWVVELAAALPRALLTMGAMPTPALVLYAVAVLAWAGLPTPEGQRLLAAARAAPIPRGAYAVVGAAVAFGLIAAPGVAAPRPTLSFTVLDVGDGDAVLLRTPGGRTVLVDGGPNPAALVSELGPRLGPLEHSIDIGIVTTKDQAHLAGAVAAAERYPFTMAISPPEESPSAIAARWSAAVGERSVVASEPLTIEIEPGVRIEVLPTSPVSVAQANPPLQRTLIVRVSYEAISLLVAPSLTPDAAIALVADGWSLRADALVVPRLGDRRGLNEQVLAEIDPALAVIPVGTRNRAGLPAPEALQLLERLPVYRTDLHGAVELRTDGRSIWVSPERAVAEAAAPV